MNKKILFGSLLASFLMLMTPAMQAIQVDKIEETNEIEISDFVKTKVKSFKEVIQKLQSKFENQNSNEIALDDCPDCRDGPDDPTDYFYLAVAGAYIGFIFGMVIEIVKEFIDKIKQLIGIPQDEISISPLELFIREAFDIEDCDGDGR